MSLPALNTTVLSPLIFDGAVKGFLLLSAAFLTVHCMKRRAAASRHLTLSLTLGGLLILPLLSSNLPALRVLPHWLGFQQSPSTRTDLKPAERSLPQEDTSETSSPKRAASSKDSLHEIPATAFGTPDLSPDTQAASLPRWALLVWVLGAFCALMPTAAGLISLFLLRRNSRVIDSGATYKLLHQLKAATNCRQNILLLTAPARRMPMTWGILKPKILLPPNSLHWPKERLRVVLLHELAHIQRLDFLTTLISRMACAVHWFNPLAWIASRQMSYEQEKACDDVVLSTGATPEAYAEDILKLSSDRTSYYFESHGAVAMARPSNLEARLLAILDDTKNRASLTRTGNWIAIVVAALAVIPTAMLQAVNQRTERPDGLVAWWRADGDGKDSAGNHDGTFPFGDEYVPGVHGRAFNFLRSHAIEDQLRRVSIPDSPDFQFTEAMTLEAWVFPVAYGGIVLLRGDDRAGLDSWHLDLMNEGRINFHFNTADNQSAGVSAPIQLNQLQHVTAVFDHGMLYLYINSVLLAQTQTDLRPITVLDKKANPAIGIGNAGGKHYSMPFNGIIDEVRIYNRALSEAEIEDRMKR